MDLFQLRHSYHSKSFWFDNFRRNNYCVFNWKKPGVCWLLDFMDILSTSLVLKNWRKTSCSRTDDEIRIFTVKNYISINQLCTKKRSKFISLSLQPNVVNHWYVTSYVSYLCKPKIWKVYTLRLQKYSDKKFRGWLTTNHKFDSKLTDLTQFVLQR